MNWKTYYQEHLCTPEEAEIGKLCASLIGDGATLQLGIVMYLGCLGLASGANFFDTIVHGNGWQWVLIGAVITVLPILIVGWIAMKNSHRSYGATCGMLCGSMANPMALDYLTDKVHDDSHNVSYATVYPLSMFLRIITAQILLLLIV